MVLENIATSFSRLDIAAWLANFHMPPMIVTVAGCVRPSDAAEAEILFNALITSFRGRGFIRSSIDACSMKFLTPATAIASVVFSRHAGDELLERLGATYILQMRDDRWGGLVFTGHGPEAHTTFD